MTDADKNIIHELVAKLRETVDENDKLRAENERLKATASAHQTLASIYTDPNQPTGHRIRAATAALACETPRLESVAPAIDATCEEIEPLHLVVERQRKRADALLALPLAEREAMIRGVVRSDGDGSDDSSSND